MNEIKQLLHFDFAADQFVAHGAPLISRETRKRLELTRRKLEEVSSNHFNLAVHVPPDRGTVYRTFLQLAPQGIDTLRQVFHTARQIRRLAWSLHYREDDLPAIVCSDFLPLALQLITDQWRYGMTLGLFDTLLRHWDHPNAGLLRTFLADKLQHYTRKSPSILPIKENERFYTEESGTDLLAIHLIHNQQRLSTVWQSLHLPDHMHGYAYFAETGIAFTQRVLPALQFEQYIPDILAFLYLHQRRDTTKQCLSKVILRIQGSDNLELHKQVKSATFDLIGDPNNDVYWKPWKKANQQEKEALKKAQRIAREWLTEEFIALFFAQLAMDKEREDFWISYAPHVSWFRIFGHPALKDHFLHEKHLRPFWETRFGFLLGTEKEESALVMVIKNHAFIEFSNSAEPFYAYKLSNPLCPDLSRNTLSVQDLRPYRDMPLLMNREGNVVRSEGKFLRHTGWQKFLTWWLQQYLGIS